MDGKMNAYPISMRLQIHSPESPSQPPTVVCLNFPDPVMRKDDRVILTNLLIQLPVKASIITGDHFYQLILIQASSSRNGHNFRVVDKRE